MQFLDNVVLSGLPELTLAGGGGGTDPAPPPEPTNEPPAEPEHGAGEKEHKREAIRLLSPYVGESERIKRAISEIEKSLNDRLWVDDTHLDPKHGHKVFDYELRAVELLMDLLEEPDGVSPGALSVVPVAMDHLAAADRILADILINDNRATLDAEVLAEAEEELREGDESRDAGEFDEAIEHYHKAWSLANRAALAAREAQEDD